MALFGLQAQAALRGTALQWLAFGPTKYINSSVIFKLNNIDTSELISVQIHTGVHTGGDMSSDRKVGFS